MYQNETEFVWIYFMTEGGLKSYAYRRHVSLMYGVWIKFLKSLDNSFLKTAISSKGNLELKDLIEMKKKKFYKTTIVTLTNNYFYL